MQVNETKREGLSREYTVTVPAQDIEQRVATRLSELSQTVRIDGFRPGKVPAALLRKRYGQAVRGEVLEAAVMDSSTKAIAEQGLRPAMQPKIELKSFDEGKDLEYTIALDVMPDIEAMDFKTLKLERPVAAIEDKEVQETVERLAASNTRTEPIEKPRPAEKGDVVVIDFKGTIDGEAFPGGSAEGHQLELGAGRFIPGFEEQLSGAEPGAKLDIKVTFPEDYGAADLAGKDAVFATEVKEIHEKVATQIDDEFAKSFGLEGLDALKGEIRQGLERDYAAVSRARLKRALLDALDEAHDFELPPGMVEAEFESIWTQFEEARKQGQIDEADQKKTDEELCAEYRGIAERRVRLGLLLAEVGRRADLQVSPEEINNALVREAQRYPGQERQVIDFYRNNEQAMASLRAPLYEDKVIDYILEMATVTEKKVTVEDLTREPDAAEEPAKKAKSAGAKKPAAKKAPAKTRKAVAKPDKTDEA